MSDSPHNLVVPLQRGTGHRLGKFTGPGALGERLWFAMSLWALAHPPSILRSLPPSFGRNWSSNVRRWEGGTTARTRKLLE